LYLNLLNKEESQWQKWKKLFKKCKTGGAPIPTQVKMMVLDLLKNYGVEIHTKSTVREITLDGAVLSRDGRSTVRIRADTVVLSIGMTTKGKLADSIEKTGMPSYRIGDCRKPKNIMNEV
jgi:2-enoate reductase